MSDDVISGLQRGTCTPDRYNYSSDIMMMSSRWIRDVVDLEPYMYIHARCI